MKRWKVHEFLAMTMKLVEGCGVAPIGAGFIATSFLHQDFMSNANMANIRDLLMSMVEQFELIPSPCIKFDQAVRIDNRGEVT
jgi:hypothetical protein